MDVYAHNKYIDMHTLPYPTLQLLHVYVHTINTYIDMHTLPYPTLQLLHVRVHDHTRRLNVTNKPVRKRVEEFGDHVHVLPRGAQLDVIQHVMLLASAHTPNLGHARFTHDIEHVSMENNFALQYRTYINGVAATQLYCKV